MSFAIWKEKPPFVFTPADAEQIYPVGDVWIVTDDPAKATQEYIDALQAAQPTPDPLAVLTQVVKDKLGATDEDFARAADTVSAAVQFT